MSVVTGAVEISLAPGGDFQLQPNGDLVLAIDTNGATPATQQRLYRLLTTNPGDDLFNPQYGAGLPALVGQPTTAASIAQLRAKILSALLSDPSVASSPAPSITIQPVGTNALRISITCYGVNGQIYTIPSFVLTSNPSAATSLQPSS